MCNQLNGGEVQFSYLNELSESTNLHEEMDSSIS